MRKSGAFVLAALLVAGASNVARATGSLTIGLADGKSSYIVDYVEQGDDVVRHVRVGNTTDAALTVDVYASAADDRHGKFRWDEGHATNQLTSWTTVDPDQTTVPSQRAADVTVTIRVPKDASLGKRYGVVWAELPRSDSGVVNRVGVRIYLTVTEPSDSSPTLVIVLVALVLVAAVSAISVAARRRGSARGGSTEASP